MASAGVLFVVKILIFISLISAACCLRCTTCRDKTAGWDECVAQNKSVECTIEKVNGMHNAMSRDNHGLLEFDVDLEESATFSCFTIESNMARGDASQRVLVAGCTLETVEFCKGWSSNVEITRCGTCKTTGLCSSGGDRNVIERMLAGVSVLGAVIALRRLF
ncbi:uncharacterized protein LOC109418216 [Aedes albopictus]|uniref:Salivary secreted peptide n=1 Tax=Aedes albopictus TaxID=7160 RepID=A0ABM1XQW0_AEDAL